MFIFQQHLLVEFPKNDKDFKNKNFKKFNTYVLIHMINILINCLISITTNFYQELKGGRMKDDFCIFIQY